MTADGAGHADHVPSERRRQRRAIERKNAILEATLRLLARDGAALTSHRAVAAEAGVPLAATAYYFESKEDLFAEAFHLHAMRESRRVATAADGLDTELTPRELAQGLAAFVLHGLGPERERLLAEYELLVYASRQRELAELSRAWHEGMREQLEATLREAGAGTPALDARIVLAVLAGLEVDNLATRDIDRDEVEAVMHRLVTALLAEAH